MYCQHSFVSSESDDDLVKLEIRVMNSNNVDDSKSKKIELVMCNSEWTPQLVTFNGVDCKEEYNITVYIQSQTESDVILCSTDQDLSYISLPCAGNYNSIIG